MTEIESDRQMAENSLNEPVKEKKKSCLYRLWRFFLRLFLLIFSATVIFYIMLNIKMPYIYQSPGSCEAVSEYINIKGIQKIKTFGQFYLTTVIYERANLFLYIYGLLDPDVDVKKIEDLKYEQNDDIKNDYMADQMEGSILRAKISAFRALGYNIDINPNSVRIINIQPWSMAAGVLKPGDLILEANGKKTLDEENLQDEVIKTRKTGYIDLKISRTDEKGLKVVQNIRAPLTPYDGSPRIGVQIMSDLGEIEFPIRVDIQPVNIIGSSAGLMFALEIIKQISRVDLTGGLKIAGTGAIDERGTVFPIEGVEYKVIAAEEKKCEYFLCPVKNVEDARKRAKKIKIIPVKNLGEALKKLKEINPEANLDAVIKKREANIKI